MTVFFKPDYRNGTVWCCLIDTGVCNTVIVALKSLELCRVNVYSILTPSRFSEWKA